MIARSRIVTSIYDVRGDDVASEIQAHYKIANSLAERTEAYRLVYQNYVRKGLIQSNRYELRVTPYHLLPTTNTFLAIHENEVLATVTLIGDGELGLPMESIYGREVEAARQRGLYVGEVTCLATRELDFQAFLPVFVRLTRLMAQHARAYGMDQFLIATHPKHARFYQRFMGFHQIGGYKDYPSVQNAPAVACCLDFIKIDRERPACYEQFFGTSIPDTELFPRPMSHAEAEFFRPVTQWGGQCVPICA